MIYIVLFRHSAKHATPVCTVVDAHVYFQHLNRIVHERHGFRDWFPFPNLYFVSVSSHVITAISLQHFEFIFNRPTMPRAAFAHSLGQAPWKAIYVVVNFGSPVAIMWFPDLCRSERESFLSSQWTGFYQHPTLLWYFFHHLARSS